MVDKRKVIELVVNFLEEHKEVIIPVKTKIELVDRLRDLQDIDVKEICEFD